MFPLIFNEETGLYYPDYSSTNLEVHHIVPVAWAIRIKGWKSYEYNDLANLVLIDSNNHRRIIHEPTLRLHYAYVCRDYDTIRAESEIVSDKINNEQPYWNTFYDDQLKEIAETRTEEFRKRNNRRIL
jgi:hypothetical protein